METSITKTTVFKVTGYEFAESFPLYQEDRSEQRCIFCGYCAKRRYILECLETVTIEFKNRQIQLEESQTLPSICRDCFNEYGGAEVVKGLTEKDLEWE